MKTTRIIVEWMVLLFALVIGLFSFLLLIGETEDFVWLIISKIIAIIGFIITYGCFKWLNH